MKTILSLLAILCLSRSLNAQQNQNFIPEEMVVRASSLNLRDTPDVTGKKVGSVPKGAVVKVLEVVNNGEYAQVDTIYAPWYKVEYKNKTGYAFGAYLINTINLYYEDEMFFEPIPPDMNWYGVYMRDSSSDEIRRVTVQVQKQYNEMFGQDMEVLKTNQSKPSKFLIATTMTLKPGYAGPLGVYDINDYFMSSDLGPGRMLGITPGQEPADTNIYASYLLAATGCARLTDGYVAVDNYMLQLLYYYDTQNLIQDLTPWVKTEMPESSPSVSLMWFGDIDGDHKADMILNDCPYEVGCRASIFLSSKSKPGEFVHKVCEHFYPME